MTYKKIFIIVATLTLIAWVFVALNSTPRDYTTALGSIPGFIILAVIYFKILK